MRLEMLQENHSGGQSSVNSASRGCGRGNYRGRGNGRGNGHGQGRGNSQGRCRMDLPGSTASVGTRTDYSVGPWDYLTYAARYLMA
jgi:hypothetical protein